MAHELDGDGVCEGKHKGNDAVLSLRLALLILLEQFRQESIEAGVLCDGQIVIYLELVCSLNELHQRQHRALTCQLVSAEILNHCFHAEPYLIFQRVHRLL